MTTTPRKRRSDAGTERSEYVERPCQGPECERTVRRRVTEMRPTAYCALPCYRAAGSPTGGRGGRPRSTSTLLVETADGIKTAVLIEGYVQVYWPDHPMSNKSGRVGLHRAVMAEHLGRLLLPGERPHHRNGDRQDNRLSNLELWTTAQPAGQRVEDKVAFARSVLGLYGDEAERDRYSSEAAALA